MRRTYDFFAVVTPGMEAIAGAELSALGVEVGEVNHGGVAFRGGLLDAFKLQLHARTLGRVWLRLGSFRAKGFPELYNKAAKMDWARFVSPGSNVHIKASAHESRLYHTGRLEVTLLDAIRSTFETGAPPNLGEGGVTVLARLEKDRCTLSVDVSGEPLHKRGYREATGRAPLRETMAASVLMWAGWTGDTPLLDPMCGSGTFLIEGAWIAARRPPGLSRDFAFEKWAKWDQYGWRRLKTEAVEEKDHPRPRLIGVDHSEETLAAARSNAQRAGLAEDTIEWRAADASSLTPPEDVSPGLIVCNAPYGKRIGSPKSLASVYKGLGKALKGFEGWRVVLLHTKPGLRERFDAALGAKAEDRLVFRHGGLKVTASRYAL